VRSISFDKRPLSLVIVMRFQLVAGGLVGRGHVQDTVGINVEGDLNLRNARERGDVVNEALVEVLTT
jgi:hypothetical protein